MHDGHTSWGPRDRDLCDLGRPRRGEPEQVEVARVARPSNHRLLTDHLRHSIGRRLGWTRRALDPAGSRLCRLRVLQPGSLQGDEGACAAVVRPALGWRCEPVGRSVRLRYPATGPGARARLLPRAYSLQGPPFRPPDRVGWRARGADRGQDRRWATSGLRDGVRVGKGTALHGCGLRARLTSPERWVR